MNDQINERRKSLQTEYEAGQKMLADLDARRASLVSTLLRIEGAIQVLKEMAEPAPNGNAEALPSATLTPRLD